LHGDLWLVVRSPPNVHSHKGTATVWSRDKACLEERFGPPLKPMHMTATAFHLSLISNCFVGILNADQILLGAAGQIA
jgi:hypothetical protein